MTNVLVVDSERSIRNTLKERLEYEGYRVETAETGGEAADKTEHSRFDVVLCDMAVPDIRAIDLLTSLHGSGKSTPFIMLSALKGLDPAIDSIRHGAFDYIPKPIDLNKLLRSIRSAVEDKSQNRATIETPSGKKSSAARAGDSARVVAKASCAPTEIVGTSVGIEHMKQLIEQQSDEMFQKNKMAILAEITKIRQICCDPSLCFENYDGESAKRETCMELLKSAMDGGHKILVFSQFRSLLELLEKDLQNEGIAYFKITGETKKEDRVTFVNRFNQDETPIFLISLKAGGTGLNLTGADIVIHFDPWWNLAAQNQATDRAHRIGQTKAVSVYKLIVKDTIEEKILKMQEEKSALADEILSGHAGGLMRMSRAELLELL